ncbi:hypothetical protein [Thermocoleostomius sinensis]|uniref:Uncharacterized protein n=1 Tax=Thermocoleostomius sinensis A174 TaxID=2016057 RepID=A0A9E9C3N2_9CYAN|nr:hypothetical protein [Thermocoleostomius sinensis]WAL59131.1 hypothetical protein OXH18_18410 [Thermocoleostomius sinensis A174]
MVLSLGRDREELGETIEWLQALLQALVKQQQNSHAPGCCRPP